jgi:ABC-type multidrug transport system fused ATPase/permease subunit
MQFAVILVLMMLSAVAEIISLGAVIPFLGILAAPEAVVHHAAFQRAMQFFGATSPDAMRLPLTVLFVAAALAAGVLRIVLLWASTQVSFSAGSDLSVELYRRTLYQPYSVHVGRNTSAVLSGIGKVGGAINILTQCVILVSSAIIMVAITATLFAIDPWVASLSLAGFGGCYIVITVFTRHRLIRNSQRIADEQTQVFKAVQEGLGGIRDVLLDGSQRVYCELYQKADRPLRHGQGSNLFIAGSPRFAMEAMGMALIAALAYGLSLQPGGITPQIPILGALALGAQRLLPTLQQGYSAWATIAGNRASLADTIDLLEQPMPEELHHDVAPLALSQAIGFDRVHFHYANPAMPVLQEVTLTIPKGARVGLTGATGSGKSTAMDILMGLLTPTQGVLLVDGQAITEYNLRAWQKNIAHVPQHIYLSDASIAENIAFGIPRERIDMTRVKWAAAQAQIAPFIEQGEHGYNAVIGERGIRLSGGQRQRLGIARALYKQATVLVFDEATSALDTLTEQSLMDAIESLDRNLTILIIAHRLSTVRRCDSIIELSHGRVVAQGTFNQLLESSTSFRKMANG